MTVKKISRTLPALAAALLFIIPSLWAQQLQDPAPSGNSTSPLPPLVPADANSNTAPAPAGRGLFIGADPQQAPSTQPLADPHVLSDSEALGIGLERGRRNIFNFSLLASQSVDTGITPGVLNYATTFGGNLSLDQSWSRYHLVLGYNGGDSIYRPNSVNSGPYHDFTISQEIRWSRWRLVLRDDVVFSSQATFGGLDLGGPGLMGQIHGPSITLPTAAPGQTILTGRAERLQNVALANLNYRINPRATLTFSGAYGLLHFLPDGYVDSHNTSGRVGYDYAVDAKNSIAVFYDYAHAGFSGGSGQIQSQDVQLAYGRKLTGRLAFQMSGGPQLLHLRNLGAQNSHRWSWSAFSALTYRMRRTTYTLQYLHSTSAGSGVFLGSDNHAVAGGLTHAFTRNWSASLNGGYAMNRNLLPSTVAANRFDTWTGGASLNRQQGRYLYFGLTYGYQQQSSAAGICPVAVCAVTGPRHIVSFMASWHLRPVTFD